MTDIRFYHAVHHSVERALPGLLAKIVSTGQRVVLRAVDAGQVERWNDALWTYDAGSFLPHGCAKDGMAQEQPIWITADDEAPNGGRVIVCVGGAVPADMGAYDVCCLLFDGNDMAAVEQARGRWKAWSAEDGMDLTYWQQGDTGGWSKKGEG